MTIFDPVAYLPLSAATTCLRVAALEQLHMEGFRRENRGVATIGGALGGQSGVLLGQRWRRYQPARRRPAEVVLVGRVAASLAQPPPGMAQHSPHAPEDRPHQSPSAQRVAT